MKILAVMVQLEVACERCGEPMMRLGNATVTPDGRIGQPTMIEPQPLVCVKCVNAASAADRKVSRERRRFLMGKAKLKGGSDGD